MAARQQAKKTVRLADRAKVKPPQPKATAPLWAGPAGDGPQGGVTQSLLGRYLGCKERFRRRVMDGWAPADRFEPRMEFGNLWHLAEEAWAATSRKDCYTRWDVPVAEHAEYLASIYPLDRDDIAHWYNLCIALFPEYTAHWEAHPDVQAQAPLLQEQVFDVPYTLPSGRVVRLRGKWDSVDIVGKEVWIQENKTKSRIDSVKIARQCAFDLQSMFYLVALRYEYDRMGWAAKGKLAGVRYNVVRRPAHKTVESAMKTFGVDSRNGRIGDWFGRWQVNVGPEDIQRFRTTCLDPLLENLLDDYEWWTHCQDRGNDPFDGRERYALFVSGRVGPIHDISHCPRHFRYPFGVYNPLEEGGATDLHALLDTGSTSGLRRLTDLFPELAIP